MARAQRKACNGYESLMRWVRFRLGAQDSSETDGSDRAPLLPRTNCYLKPLSSRSQAFGLLSNATLPPNDAG